MGKKFHAWPTKWEYNHQVFRVHSVFHGVPPVMRVKVDLPFDEMRAVRKVAEARGLKITELAAQLLRDAVPKAPPKSCVKCDCTIEEPVLDEDEPERCKNCSDPE